MKLLPQCKSQAISLYIYMCGYNILCTYIYIYINQLRDARVMKDFLLSSILQSMFQALPLRLQVLLQLRQSWLSCNSYTMAAFKQCFGHVSAEVDSMGEPFQLSLQKSPPLQLRRPPCPPPPKFPAGYCRIATAPREAHKFNLSSHGAEPNTLGNVCPVLL